MPPRIAYLYSAVAIVFAVAFGVGVGPYWADDAIALAAMALAAIMLSLNSGQAMKVLAFWWAPASRVIKSRPVSRAPASQMSYNSVPRSEIVHFVILSRIEFKSAAALDSYNTFERALLCKKGWQEITADELKTLAEAHRT